MHIDRLGRYILTLSLAILSVAPYVAAKSRIVPLETSATFSAQSPEKRWSVPIKSADGGTIYVLSLEPDFDVGHRVVTMELVLRHPGDSTDAANLLDPTGGRHGLQGYDFSAVDLAHGAQKSAFGGKRTVSLKSLGLVARITILKATVSPMSTGNYQLETLDLRIEVDNSDL